MPNLLTTLTPTVVTPASVQAGGSGSANAGKSPLLTDSFAMNGGAGSFPDTLSEQLAGATEWLNLTTAGQVPTELLLPLDGNGLPLTGAELQAELEGTLADVGQGGASFLLTGLPLLPPGMAPLDANAVQPGEADFVLLARTGNRPGDPLNTLGKGESGAGIGTLLNGTAGAVKAMPDMVLMANGSGAEADQELLQVLSESLAGERGALRGGSDPLTLRGLVNVLQGGENLQAASAVATNPAFALASTTPPSSVATLPLFTIDIPPGQPGWGEALGERVAWMLNNQQPGAQLRINPPHLGPLDIKVSVHNDQASITFTAHHALTADHLEAALPRLREMLAESGLQLSHFDVRHEGGDAQAQGGERKSGAVEGDPTEGIADAEGAVPTSVTILNGSGLVDTFA